ncbi:MAG: PilX N-terminal domain-containing pilus assembly protein [Sulfurifustis sp.]
MLPTTPGRLPNPGHEKGATLVTALVILLILTIIGIAAMRTSSFEERMAGNIQDTTYAFEAAESGLNRAMNEGGTLSLTTEVTRNYTFGAARAETKTKFNEFAPPKRGSGYSVTSFDAANFDQTSTGMMGDDASKNVAKSVVHRGVEQIVPKAQ